jgi:phosphomannomutase/phosphoglucomutase
MSPWCADTEKYQVLERLVEKLVAKAEAAETLGGRAIKEVVTVNGARVILDNGSWGLVRASSNTPNLVVVCESSDSEAEMRAIFADIDAVIRTEESVGDYDQTI